MFVGLEHSIWGFGKSGDNRSFTHNTDLISCPVVVRRHLQKKRDSYSHATNSPQSVHEFGETIHSFCQVFFCDKKGLKENPRNMVNKTNRQGREEAISVSAYGCDEFCRSSTLHPCSINLIWLHTRSYLSLEGWYLDRSLASAGWVSSRRSKYAQFTNQVTGRDVVSSDNHLSYFCFLAIHVTLLCHWYTYHLRERESETQDIDCTWSLRYNSPV